MDRNTKQKQIVYEVLMENKTHPTMKEIYSLAKKKDPTIGQATIYRNVHKLFEDGKLRKIDYSGKEYFDINQEEHIHLVCKKCGKITDLFEYYIEDIRKILNEQQNFKCEEIQVLVTGLCSNCQKKEG